MRNFRIGKLRRLRCDNGGDDREALPRSPPSAMRRRAEWRLSSDRFWIDQWSVHTKEHQTTNLGVRSSNLFGRAIKSMT